MVQGYMNGTGVMQRYTGTAVVLVYKSTGPSTVVQEYCYGTGAVQGFRGTVLLEIYRSSAVVQEQYGTTWVVEKCRVTGAQVMHWFRGVQE